MEMDESESISGQLLKPLEKGFKVYNTALSKEIFVVGVFVFYTADTDYANPLCGSFATSNSLHFCRACNEHKNFNACPDLPIDEIKKTTEFVEDIRNNAKLLEGFSLFKKKY